MLQAKYTIYKSYRVSNFRTIIFYRPLFSYFLFLSPTFIQPRYEPHTYTKVIAIKLNQRAYIHEAKQTLMSAYFYWPVYNWSTYRVTKTYEKQRGKAAYIPPLKFSSEASLSPISPLHLLSIYYSTDSFTAQHTPQKVPDKALYLHKKKPSQEIPYVPGTYITQYRAGVRSSSPGASTSHGGRKEDNARFQKPSLMPPILVCARVT